MAERLLTHAEVRRRIMDDLRLRGRVLPHASPTPTWRHSWCSDECPHHPRIVLDEPTPVVEVGRG